MKKTTLKAKRLVLDRDTLRNLTGASGTTLPGTMFGCASHDGDGCITRSCGHCGSMTGDSGGGGTGPANSFVTCFDTGCGPVVPG